jgi:hypothetical protein
MPGPANRVGSVPYGGLPVLGASPVVEAGHRMLWKTRAAVRNGTDRHPQCREPSVPVETTDSHSNGGREPAMLGPWGIFRRGQNTSGSLASGYAFSKGHGYAVILVTSPFGSSRYALFGGK